MELLVPLLIILIVIIAIAWGVTFIIDAFMPIDGRIKQIVNTFIWIVALVAILLKVAMPLIALI